MKAGARFQLAYNARSQSKVLRISWAPSCRPFHRSTSDWDLAFYVHLTMRGAPQDGIGTSHRFGLTCESGIHASLPLCQIERTTHFKKHCSMIMKSMAGRIVTGVVSNVIRFHVCSEPKPAASCVALSQLCSQALHRINARRFSSWQ